METVGCGRIFGPYLHERGGAIRSRKPIYYWNATNDAAVFATASAFRPWLGARRRAQLEPVLEFTIRRIVNRLVSKSQTTDDGSALVPAEPWRQLVAALGEEK